MSFLGPVQAVLSIVQGRVRGFSLPVRGRGAGGIYWDLLPVDAKPQPPPQTWEETASISPRTLPGHHPAPGLSQGLAALGMLAGYSR